MDMAKQTLINLIDYTLLKPTTTKDHITQYFQETIEYGFQTVLVNPSYVKYAYEMLKDHTVAVGAPISVSLGSATTTVKVVETKDANQNGATEIDMLINLGALKSGEYDVVQHDISEVVKQAGDLTTKVI